MLYRKNFGLISQGRCSYKGFDSCLFLYTKRMGKAGGKLQFAVRAVNTRAFARLMLAGAMDVEIDGQGRIVLPEYLRQFAGLSKEVIVAGLYSRLELWDSVKWSEYKAKQRQRVQRSRSRWGSWGVIYNFKF